MQLVKEVLVHFVKTKLRIINGQARPNWCLTLHAQKERADALSMTSIANEFVSRNPSRIKIFGKFVNFTDI